MDKEEIEMGIRYGYRSRSIPIGISSNEGRVLRLSRESSEMY